MSSGNREDGTDRAEERRWMVESQLEVRGLRNERVLSAMANVPRHRFVPAHLAHAAYDDTPLPIGEGQTISQPYMVARTCELARIAPDARVLDVGTGSGYQAAVLGQLASQVVGVELVPRFAREAQRKMEELGYDNVRIVCGDGTKGHPEAAPYDAIVVAAAAREVPPALVEQLAQGGRLVIPVGGPAFQTLTVVHRTSTGLETHAHEHCVFVPLLGAD